MITQATMLPRAACVVVINDNYEILSVSRRGDPSAFGLPGGKLENGEHTIEAAIRETFEETGLQMERKDLMCVYEGDDGHGYNVTAYMWKHSCKPDAVTQMEPDMAVCWVTPAQLLQGPFKQFNDAVLKKLTELARQSLR